MEILSQTNWTDLNIIKEKLNYMIWYPQLEDTIF